MLDEDLKIVLGCCVHTDRSVVYCSVCLRTVWFVHWLKHLRAGLLLFFKKKKQSVECSADSQKVMQCLKAEGGGGGGSPVKPWTIQDLSLPNMPSVLSESIRHQVMWVCCFLQGFISSTKFILLGQRSLHHASHMFTC